MNTLFLKNFKEMTDGELDQAWTKYGEMEVTSRVFADIVGRERKCLSEDKILLGVLVDLTSGEDELEFPFATLLQLEYGKSVTPVNKLPEDVLSYLLNTPYDVVRMDYGQAVLAARELFERRLAA